MKLSEVMPKDAYWVFEDQRSMYSKYKNTHCVIAYILKYKDDLTLNSFILIRTNRGYKIIFTIYNQDIKKRGVFLIGLASTHFYEYYTLLEQKGDIIDLVEFKKALASYEARLI